ncbi:nuclear transport factor 2 family protein [Mycolicibacterium iranicum]|uniref:Nuclear transport factor 2 family protein n=1 Tax=Mycolicibacterium iranicum TaxID=912594 RepID=A0ABT4HDP6_MYCIR|nr:nuclear transport factor 2 family protein [Mycolicibacterium iranicum]MCZ0728310.1 nuclear transport factor 2 family protein [Mycolicibacterium iranicum]
MQMWELEVRESVRQTLADYTAATDGFDLKALAACFGAEGILQFTGGQQPLAGPEAIADGLAAAMSGPRESMRLAPTFVRHHVSSVRFISVAADRVEASSYFAVYTDIGLDHWGRYRDVLTPIGDRWLFASRRISVDAFSKASLMAQ